MTLGFGVMGSECALFLGIVVALSDVLPALGSGFVLIPWFVVELLQRDYKSAAVLATMFVVVTFLREILEPKLFGTAANIKPLYVLIAVYAGVELFGVAGYSAGTGRIDHPAEPGRRLCSWIVWIFQGNPAAHAGTMIAKGSFVKTEFFIKRLFVHGRH